MELNKYVYGAEMVEKKKNGSKIIEANAKKKKSRLPRVSVYFKVNFINPFK